MKRIYVKAYCQQNLGDDMFVQALVRRYPKTLFYMFANPLVTNAFYTEKNLKTSSSFEFFIYKVLSKLKLADMDFINKFFHKISLGEVHIGGSIFIEPKSWQSLENEYKNSDSADYYIGANFGPYKTQSFYDQVRYKIKNSTDCCFRDKYSYSIFRDLPNVRYAPDVLFGYKFFPEYKTGKGVGISVISLKNRPQIENMKEVYYSTIAKCCNYCISNSIPVSLFSFCKLEGDEEAIEEILKYVNRPECVNVIKYTGNIANTLDEMNSCEFILATRFHAMVLGWAMKKKVLPIVYSKKQTNVINDIGYSGPVWNLIDGQEYYYEDLLEDCFTNNSPDTNTLAKETEAHFKALDEFIQKL